MANLFKIGNKFETSEEFNNLFPKWCTENVDLVRVYYILFSYHSRRN